jgi:hypothetical protein
MRLVFKGSELLPEYRGFRDGRLIHLYAGEAVEVKDEAGDSLLREFPGLFVEDIAFAPADKQIKEPRRRK